MSDAALASGRRVLHLASTLARRLWRERLTATYGLGSLAHGGFSSHVSDVDFGVILADPLEAADGDRVTRLGEEAAASGLPFADRLSVFWGTPQTLAGTARGGRFPPVDVCDLRRYGRLLDGRDVRDSVVVPSAKELLIASAEFALARLATPEVMQRIHDPAGLAATDARTLTKLVLFPVRFLFTARTGRVGLNDEAARHFARQEAPDVAALASAALEWRNRPPHPAEAETILREALSPLYRRFAADFSSRLAQLGEAALAARYREWLHRLSPARQPRT